MNIRGLSEATLDQLIRLGALKGYQDLYHFDRYRDEVIALEGFGEKSYENLIASPQHNLYTLRCGKGLLRSPRTFP